jgi:hypothetical protein
MKLTVKLLALCAAAALAGCEGRADENLAAAAENGVEAVGEAAEDVADAAANTAGEVGAAVENGVESATDELEDDDAGNNAAAGNGQ